MAEKQEGGTPDVVEDVVDDFELDIPELDALPDEEPDAEGGDVEDPDKQGDGKQTSTDSLSDIEKIAYAQGWRPKDEFIKSGNDPKAWKEAGWWLDRGELLGQQSQLRKEVKQIKDAFIRMTANNRDAYVKGQQDILKQMKADKVAALRAGDNEVVAELEERIDHQSEVVAAVVQEAKQPIVQPEDKTVENSALYQNWLRDNTWYTSDKVLYQFANSVMAVYVKENPQTTPEKALDYVTGIVKSEFAHKFNGTRKVATPAVGGRGNQATPSQAGKTGSGNIDARFQKIVGGMDADTRRAVIDLVRSGDLTKKEYVDGYVD